MPLACQTNKLTFVSQDIAQPAPSQTENKAPSTAGMTTKVVKGSLWTMAGNVLPQAISLITTPFTIRLLGAEGYGIVILIALIPTYLGFADFGMATASTKFGSEAYGEGDADKEARIIRTSALITFLSSFAVALVVMIFSSAVIDLFDIAAVYHADAVIALRIAAVSFVLSTLSQVFNTPQLTRLRMDLQTFITAGTRTFGHVATPIVLYFGFGIIGAVSVICAAAFINLVWQIIVSRKLLPQLFDSGLEMPAIGKMLRYGSSIVIASVAVLLLNNIEKGLLAKTVSATALGYYSIAFTLATVITLFSAAMVQSLIPAFSQLQTHEHREQLTSIYSRTIRLSMLWSLPVLLILALTAKPFFTLWAGPDFGDASSVPLYFLLVGLLFNIFALIPHSVILASGRTDILAKLYWVELPPYILLVWWMSSKYGAAGAAAAWSIRVIVDAALHFYVARSVLDIKFEGNALPGFALGTLIMSAPVAAAIYFGETNILIVAIGIACVFGYGLIALRTIVTKEEAKWLFSMLKNKLAVFSD